MKKIAIIDTGYDFISYDDIFAGKYHFYIENNEIIQNNEAQDEVGHGTAITRILLDGIQNIQSYSFYLIKIFGKTLRTDVRLVCAALEFCLDERIDFINLSLGVMTNDPTLELLCKKLTENNCIIFSSHDTKYYNVYPACYPCVVSIAPLNNNSIDANEYICLRDENAKYNILAYAGLSRVFWLNNLRIAISGVSFACPRIMAKLINVLDKRVGVCQMDLTDVIEANARRTLKPLNSGTIKVANRICLFPFNKEMHSLLRFRDELGGAITCVCDFRGRGLIGRNAFEIINDETEQILCIGDVEKDHQDDTFDSVIIGDLSDISRLYGRRVYECLSRWQKKGKCLYSIADNECFRNIGVIVPPKVNADFYESNIAPDLLYYDGVIGLMPVVCIGGTSKRQGKFTLQKRINDYLRRNNIWSLTITTEHQALYLNSDATFAYGGKDESLVDLPLESFLSYFDVFQKSVSLRKGKLIIFSLQSGLIAMEEGSKKNAIINHAMLSIIRPEVSILVVNYFDDMRRIDMNFSLLNAFSKRGLACLAMYCYDADGSPIQSEKANEKMKILEDRFGRVCYNINDIEGISKACLLSFRGGSHEG